MNPTKNPDYEHVFGAMADLVNAAHAPGLAAVLVLNGALAVTLSVFGPQKLTEMLNLSIKELAKMPPQPHRDLH